MDATSGSCCTCKSDWQLPSTIATILEEASSSASQARKKPILVHFPVLGLILYSFNTLDRIVLQICPKPVCDILPASRYFRVFHDRSWLNRIWFSQTPYFQGASLVSAYSIFNVFASCLKSHYYCNIFHASRLCPARIWLRNSIVTPPSPNLSDCEFTCGQTKTPSRAITDYCGKHALSFRCPQSFVPVDMAIRQDPPASLLVSKYNLRSRSRELDSGPAAPTVERSPPSLILTAGKEKIKSMNGGKLPSHFLTPLGI